MGDRSFWGTDLPGYSSLPESIQRVSVKSHKILSFFTLASGRVFYLPSLCPDSLAGGHRTRTGSIAERTVVVGEGGLQLKRA